ncbi:hypothetical protein Golax_021573, partial [Gossypium laxum]|nr:hypothetical protein [Gossypium laxum]
SSITVNRKLLEGSGFLACGHYRPGVQVGSETHQRVNREVETRDGHISSSIRRVYHHFGGRAVTIKITGGWVHTFPKLGNDSTEVERIRYAQVYILEMIREQLVNLVGGLPCWQHCTGRCTGQRHQIKPKSYVAYHYYNHGLGFAFHFYVLECTTH